jgi:hypothetical protein
MQREQTMKRMWIALGALAVTLAALSLAMLLGSASFDFRRFSQHEGRLRRVMREAPTADRLTRGLADEGTLLIAAPSTPEETARVVAEKAGAKTTEVRAKAARYAHMRVYRTADMLYFIFFDETGVMRDFTCVSR